MFYFLVLLPNLVWPFIAKALWHTRITALEVVVQVLVVFSVGWGTYNLSTYWQAQDVEVLNGEVTYKKKAKVSCEHSYRCNCYTTCSTNSQGHQSCTEHCSTCYDHPYDFDWVVGSNIGTWEIRRLDRQGLKEPPRWTMVQYGDPVSKTQSFQNLVKIAQNSLYNTQKPAGISLPGYPSSVYDYYKHDPLLTVGVSLTAVERKAWNSAVSNVAKKIGPGAHANPIVVLVKGQGAEYANHLQAAWLGGKLNDVVLVVGTDDGKTVKWARTFSWSEKDMVNVLLRDKVLELSPLTPDGVAKAFWEVVPKHFQKRSKKSFDYLKDEIQPSTATLVWTFILCLGINVVLTLLFHKEEILPPLNSFRRNS